MSHVSDFSRLESHRTHPPRLHATCWPIISYSSYMGPHAGLNVSRHATLTRPHLPPTGRPSMYVNTTAKDLKRCQGASAIDLKSSTVLSRRRCAANAHIVFISNAQLGTRSRRNSRVSPARTSHPCRHSLSHPQLPVRSAPRQRLASCEASCHVQSSSKRWPHTACAPHSAARPAMRRGCLAT